MNRKITLALCILAATTLSSCAQRQVRLAKDITPGNPKCAKMDWRYGASDIKVQTTKVTSVLMDRWYMKLGGCCDPAICPIITVTDVDNRTDQFISTDMIREIFEGVAVNDGRFRVAVGDYCDEKELDATMDKIQNKAKYQNETKLRANRATAPQFLAKVRITKAVNSDNRYDYEDYRMSVTLYDIESQEAVDSAWDVLRKRVQA